ncbi:MAG: hypothetical protein JWQ71_364 [Pedosphaera sp.]|nr:hypothetical protein [Pedosphaera sp.]
MKRAGFIYNRLVAAVLLALAIGFACGGCASTEPDNVSSRPWNSPEGWQNGSLPGTLTQPR